MPLPEPTELIPAREVRLCARRQAGDAAYQQLRGLQPREANIWDNIWDNCSSPCGEEPWDDGSSCLITH